MYFYMRYQFFLILVTSCLSSCQFDRDGAQHTANCIFQSSVFNRTNWFALEKFRVAYAINNGFDNCSYNVIPIYCDDQNIRIMQSQPVPDKLLCTLFFCNEDNTFLNRNFLMNNKDDGADFWDCEISLHEAELRLPDKRFLTKRTAHPEYFLNKDEQKNKKLTPRNLNDRDECAKKSISIFINMILTYLI